MRRILISTVALAATLLSPLATQMPLAQGTAAAVVSSGNARVIVKYRADSALLKKQAMTATGKITLQTQALGDRIGIALTPGLGISERSHVVFAKGIDSKTLAARLSAESDVEYAVPDERKHIVAAPNDSYYATRPYDNPATPASGGPLVGQWYLKTPGATGTAANTALSSINAEQAWGLTTGNSSIVIADIDTGLRFDHPDLQGGNFLQGYDMISADSDGSFTTANDCCGRHAGASDPGDWVTQQESSGSGPLSGCTVGPSSWHGTQTAGLMGAATNNGVGIAGVGYGNVKVLPVRALGKCGGFDSDIQAAMLWAVGAAVPGVPTNTNPAKVLNMSLGGSGACTSSATNPGNPGYQDVVNQVLNTGAVIVVAAGNGDSNRIGTSVGSPANCSGVIAVAALRSAGDKVGFSDLGPEIAIAAPGGNCVNTATNQPCLYPIMTTANSGTTTPVPGAAGAIYTDSFNTSLGTSFSTPLTSGTVALMFSVQSDLSPAQVLAKLQSSAKPFPTSGGSATGQQACVNPATAPSNEQGECYCTTSTCGAGMLDAHAAVLAALGVHAAITDSTATPAAGSPVVLTSSSIAGSGGAITSYVWAITSAGSTGVTISSGQGSPTLTVLPTAAGSFSVSLTVTDGSGDTSTSSATVVVAAAATTGGGGTTTGSSSGGGGALEPVWLLWLLAAVLALAIESRWRHRRAAALSASRPPSSRTR